MLQGEGIAYYKWGKRELPEKLYICFKKAKIMR
jgi:hypothetical protein